VIREETNLDKVDKLGELVPHVLGLSRYVLIMQPLGDRFAVSPKCWVPSWPTIATAYDCARLTTASPGRTPRQSG
jgi:hypothetical protein